MNKVTFDYGLDPDTQRYKDQVFERLKKDPAVMEWLETYGLDEQFLYDHTGKFSDWLKQRKPCVECAGLAYCAQAMHGCVMNLHYDGVLNFILTPCMYANALSDALAHRRYYTESCLSEEQYAIDVTALDLSQESNAYLSSVARINRLIKEQDRYKGLYLWGKPGAGKSYLAAGITNFYAKKKKRVAFVQVPKLIGELKLLFHDHEALEQKLRRIKTADVLVLDDIGGESISAWGRDEVLLPLLDERMETHRLTFFTSNYNPEELKERYVTTSNQVREPMAAERLAERIMTLAAPEFIKGNSRRN